MVLCASFKTTKAQAQAVDVGNISELTGEASVVRDKPYIAELAFNIQQNDEAIEAYVNAVQMSDLKLSEV